MTVADIACTEAVIDTPAAIISRISTYGTVADIACTPQVQDTPPPLLAEFPLMVLLLILLVLKLL
jgi:hypothetical protein